MSSPCLDDNTLARLIDGVLDDASREVVERHLDDCESCGRMLASLAHAIAPATLRDWAVGRDAGEVIAAWRRALDQLAALHRRGATMELSPDRVCVVGARIMLDDEVAAPAPASGYLAPERLDGAPPTPAADQFAACAAIWETVSGNKPFSGATVGALAVAMRSPVEVTDDGDRRTLAILARGLALDPVRRWSSIDELAAELDGRGRLRRWLDRLARS
jgi:hypothetical protein